jgi:DNA polymerase-3 subunit delta
MAKAAPASATAPVYALVGSDAFLQLQKLREVLSALPPDVQRVDVDGERAELAAVLDDLRSFAMFGGGKVIVVRSADAFISRFREQLEEYCASPSSSATLMLRLPSLPGNQRISKIIAKAGQVLDCNPPRDLKRWVMQHGKSAHKADIAPDAAELLVELIGPDLGRLDTELAKLAIAAGGRIDADAVRGAVSFQREREMWEMTNELAAGRPSAALRRWRQLLQVDPSAEFRAVTWLGMWLEDVGTVLASKAGRGPGTGKLGWKYKERLGEFVRTCERLGPGGYGRALDLLAEVDLHSKSGVGDAASNVERFILSMAEVCG